MKLKVIIAICAIGLLTACGSEPVQTVSDEEEIEEVAEEEEATFVKTGRYEYTLYVDCPDNSSETFPESMLSPESSINNNSIDFGISRELINAIFLYGVKTDISNVAQVNIEPYLDNPLEIVFYARSDSSIQRWQAVLTYDHSKYHDWLKEGSPDPMVIYMWSDSNDCDKLDAKFGYISEQAIGVCCWILQDALSNCNCNLTCALTRYNIGPDNWDKAMEECMDATGLTAEEIYANYDSSFVLRYDTLGLGDPEFAPGVLQYIGSDPIIIRYADESGKIYDDTYTLVRP